MLLDFRLTHDKIYVDQDDILVIIEKQYHFDKMIVKIMIIMKNGSVTLLAFLIE